MPTRIHVETPEEINEKERVAIAREAAKKAKPDIPKIGTDIPKMGTIVDKKATIVDKLSTSEKPKPTTKVTAPPATKAASAKQVVKKEADTDDNTE